MKINQYSATIDMHGARRDVSVDLLDDVNPGDQVMVHAGVAIAKIHEEKSEDIEEYLGNE